MTAGFSDSRLLTEKGGYLFRSASGENVLNLGVLPSIDRGERNYHYNISLPENTEIFLTGSVNTQGIFTILFKPGTRILTRGMIKSYLENYRDLSRALVSLGYRGEGKLDKVTQMLLKESGLYKAPPATLFALMTDQFPENHN